MSQFFPEINQIKFEGPASKNPLAFKYYDADKKILGKTMAEHLRFAVCFWHSFCWQGEDIFGAKTFSRPWLQAMEPMELAKQKIKAAFEFCQKINLPYFTFHDRDVAPEGNSLKEFFYNLHQIGELIATEMQQSHKKLLWGTANLTFNRRYMAGAATNPNPEIFACAVAQVKHMLDLTHQLKGENYVLWGGREGYDTLLNTNMRRELQQYGRFLQMLVDYKHKIGFRGTLLIEPKPCEPVKHMYDYDSTHVYALLQKFGLEKEYKVNIEANHATLAGHSFAQEVAYACNNDFFGSIDANQGDAQLGWDTDEFPTDLREMTLALYIILQNGGFATGGFNFDTKLRRQSIDLVDLFHGHINGIDTIARALINAAKMIEENKFKEFTQQRYQAWDSHLGQEILNNKIDFIALSKQALSQDQEPQPVSGKQELLESYIVL